jgi:hypothetical protein
MATSRPEVRNLTLEFSRFVHKPLRDVMVVDSSADLQCKSRAKMFGIRRTL